MSTQRPSGRVESNMPNTPQNAGLSRNSANDSHDDQLRTTSSSRHYVTAAQLERINSKLSDRDRSILIDIGRLGTASGRQLERLHFGSSSSDRRSARLALSALVASQVLQRLTRSVGGTRAGSKGYVYALGLAGQRILNPNKQRYRPPWTPQPSYLRHALSVSDLYVQLREAERDQSLELAVYDTEPKCWRSFAGPGGSMATLKPDAFATLYQGDFEDRYFIEVDLGTEDGTRLLTKARTYLRYYQSGKEQEASGVFPLVLWVAHTPERASFIAMTMQRLKPAEQQLFATCTRDDFVTAITTNALIAPPKEVNP